MLSNIKWNISINFLFFSPFELDQSTGDSSAKEPACSSVTTSSTESALPVKSNEGQWSPVKSRWKVTPEWYRIWIPKFRLSKRSKVSLLTPQLIEKRGAHWPPVTLWPRAYWTLWKSSFSYWMPTFGVIVWTRYGETATVVYDGYACRLYVLLMRVALWQLYFGAGGQDLRNSL